MTNLKVFFFQLQEVLSWRVSDKVLCVNVSGDAVTVLDLEGQTVDPMEVHNASKVDEGNGQVDDGTVHVAVKVGSGAQ